MPTTQPVSAIQDTCTVTVDPSLMIVLDKAGPENLEPPVYRFHKPDPRGHVSAGRGGRTKAKDGKTKAAHDKGHRPVDTVLQLLH